MVRQGLQEQNNTDYDLNLAQLGLHISSQEHMIQRHSNVLMG